MALGERRGEPFLQVLVERRTREVREHVPSSIGSVHVEIRAAGELRALEEPPDPDVS